MFTKKFYFAFALLISVTLLSYFSFQKFRPGLAKKPPEEVKGVVSDSPYSFLPPYENAIEMGHSSSSDALDKTYLIRSNCSSKIHLFYQNILTDKGWELERSSEEGGFLIKTYKKGTEKIEVRTFDKSDANECLVNLLGSGSD